jgi:hypothetical protein
LPKGLAFRPGTDPVFGDTETGPDDRVEDRLPGVDYGKTYADDRASYYYWIEPSA